MPAAEDLDASLSELAAHLPGSGGDGEYEFWKAPDLLEEIREGSLLLGQILGPAEVEECRALLSGLIGLFVLRHYGGERPGWQLNVVHKFIFPQKFEVPWTVVESLAKKYESGHLHRGWELRRLMYELADLVVPARPDLGDVTASAVSVLPDADPSHRLYSRVRQFCKRRTTLKSLAVSVYLELIQGENRGENKEGEINEHSLRRDLRRLKAWEDADPVHTRLKNEYAAAGHHWKARIPVRLYSESFRPPTPAELAESALNDAESAGADLPED